MGLKVPSNPNHSAIPWMPQKPQFSHTPKKPMAQDHRKLTPANPNIITSVTSFGQNRALLWVCCSWPSAAAPAGRFGCWSSPSAWWGCPGVSGHLPRAGRSRAPSQPAPPPSWSGSAPRWPAPGGEKQPSDHEKEKKGSKSKFRAVQQGASTALGGTRNRQFLNLGLLWFDAENLGDGTSYTPGQLSGKTGITEGINFPIS